MRTCERPSPASTSTALDMSQWMSSGALNPARVSCRRVGRGIREDGHERRRKGCYDESAWWNEAPAAERAPAPVPPRPGREESDAEEHKRGIKNTDAKNAQPRGLYLQVRH